MLSRETVIKFLEAKGAVKNCPSCGHNDWFLGNKESVFTGQLMVLEEGGGFVIPPPHIPLVILVCNNCGHLRTYAKMVIKKWAADQGLLDKEAEPKAESDA